MVSLALLLITVSTLATLSNALPTEIRHECEGSALCHIKPDGYPQQEIDSIVLKHLSQLPRMKRETPQPTWVPDNTTITNGNCAVRNNGPVRLFTVQKKGALPEVIAQTEWFHQTITEVKCENDGETSGCFAAYAIQKIRTKCETKYMHFDLITYDVHEKKLKTSKVEIGIDCACVLAEP